MIKVARVRVSKSIVGGCSSRQKFPHLALLSVCLVALALRLGIAVALPTLYYGDETFQTVEQAHRLTYGTGITPWEFVEGMRSWLLPGGLAGAMKVGEWLFGSNHGHVLGVMVFLALLSMAPVVCAFLWAYRENRTTGAGVLAGLACAVWFELVYFGPKALAEVVASHLLLFGYYLAQRDAEGPRGLGPVLAGVTLGLAVAIRPHLVPPTLLILVWTSHRAGFEWSVRVSLGTVMAVLGAGVLDWITWGLPFHSYWTYLRLNVLESGADKFGVSPWHYYFVWLIETWSWGLPVVAGLVLWGEIGRAHV